MKYRIARINELLKEELSKIIQQELEFDGAIMTIINVETSPDLGYAKIQISVLPENKKEQVLQKLNKNIFDIQQILNKKIQIRIVPRIEFKLI